MLNIGDSYPSTSTNSSLNTPPRHSSQTENNQGIDRAIINSGWLARYFWSKSNRHFERNELKRSALCNHYGDQRAELELAVDEVIRVVRKNQILSIDREDRAELSVDELNKVVMECGQEAIIVAVRKKLCSALRALLEHGLLQFSVVPATHRSQILSSGISLFSNKKQQSKGSQIIKIEARKLEHIWDVIILFLEASRAMELRDGVIGNLSDTFKLETMEGSMLPHPTSKQILLSTIEYIINSHGRLRRSQDTQWKAL
uniref:RUN domain-containing protein n=1 Tax=Meloidogyne hapla TaxID=6305 RepID=A0A1I8BLJ5_MELHA